MAGFLAKFRARSRYGPNGPQVERFLAKIPELSDDAWRGLGAHVRHLQDDLPSDVNEVALAAILFPGPDGARALTSLRFLNDVIHTGGPGGSWSIADALLPAMNAAQSEVWSAVRGDDVVVRVDASERSRTAEAIACLLVVGKLFRSDEWTQIWAPFARFLGPAERL